MSDDEHAPDDRPQGLPRTRGPHSADRGTGSGDRTGSAGPPPGSVPRVGSVDSGVYAVAGRRPPALLLIGTGLAALAGLIVLIAAAAASSDGFGGISRLISAAVGVAMLAGAAMLPLGSSRGRLVVYVICGVLVVENVTALGDSPVNVLALLQAVAVVGCISAPESNAFFGARRRRR